MKTTVRNQIIDELKNVINKYVEEEYLFAGGCCYAAYLLANCCRKLGIQYKTVIFQYNEILDETDFTNAINGDGVAHVAIEVTCNRKKTYIGDCTRIFRYFRMTGQEFNIREYSDIRPAEILSGYINNDWNSLYDTDNNLQLQYEIESIYEKYSEC